MREAPWVCCPMCDEDVCVGRFNCPENAEWCREKREKDAAEELCGYDCSRVSAQDCYDTERWPGVLQRANDREYCGLHQGECDRGTYFRDVHLGHPACGDLYYAWQF